MSLATARRLEVVCCLDGSTLSNKAFEFAANRCNGTRGDRIWGLCIAAGSAGVEEKAAHATRAPVHAHDLLPGQIVEAFRRQIGQMRLEEDRGLVPQLTVVPPAPRLRPSARRSPPPAGSAAIGPLPSPEVSRNVGEVGKTLDRVAADFVAFGVTGT